ncbi:MAG: RNA 3'-phosphate cyclase [Planctomycetes bacterium]|nr:RNA 3'-phosphate cyclase [Planctomycetota bacterium]
MAGLIELDGAQGEGGGQILRTSLSLSLLTGKAFHLRNIRAGRSRPGLQPQHLACVKAAAAIGQGQMRGASKGSSDLEFVPGKVAAGKYHFAIGTAGAASLVLHTVYLPLALADEPSHVTIDGGTPVPFSPCFHFLETTWLGYMKLLGLVMNVRMRRPGFYPRGGGLLETDIGVGQRVRGLQLAEIGLPRLARGISAVAGLPAAIARRQAERASKRLGDLGLRADIREQTWNGGPGTALTAALDTVPVPTLFFGLGARGKPAERVADDAVGQVKDYLAAQPLGIDAHSADQLLLPLSLSDEPSSFPVAQVSSHLTTSAAVIQAFLNREVRWQGEMGQSGTVQIA